MRPGIECSHVFPTLQVSDIIAAVDFYVNRLGFSHQFSWGDPPVFAGVGLDKVTLHLQKNNSDSKGASEVAFIVDNADELFAFHKANGAEVVEPIEDRSYGIRDYMIKDMDGNYLVFGKYIYNQGPAIKIERVDVPVRLEKRLAALLSDLAKYKNMSLNSCLEETLLHTFERYGDSVASPHTSATLSYIDELKKKHGIDYDTHASYRFEE